jgi:hypothetical protein
LLVILVA